MTGPRYPEGWMNQGQNADAAQALDFFDLKGMVEELLDGLHIGGAVYQRAEHTSFHPGKSALLVLDGTEIGVFGEIHPLVAERFGLTGAPRTDGGVRPRRAAELRPGDGGRSPSCRPRRRSCRTSR